MRSLGIQLATYYKTYLKVRSETRRKNLMNKIWQILDALAKKQGRLRLAR